MGATPWSCHPVGLSAVSSSEGNIRAETGSGEGDKKVTEVQALPASLRAHSQRPKAACPALGRCGHPAAWRPCAGAGLCPGQCPSAAPGQACLAP